MLPSTVCTTLKPDNNTTKGIIHPSKKACTKSIDNGMLFLCVVMSISSHTHLAIPMSIINDSTDSKQVQEVEDNNEEQEEQESDDTELSASLSYEYD
jgi:hypothetical protein